MNTHTGETDAVYLPSELLAKARQAASEEHRPADDLVIDAVRLYLEQRRLNQMAPGKNLAQLLLESPFAGTDLDLERRKNFSRDIHL